MNNKRIVERLDQIGSGVTQLAEGYAKLAEGYAKLSEDYQKLVNTLNGAKAPGTSKVTRKPALRQRTATVQPAKPAPEEVSELAAEVTGG